MDYRDNPQHRVLLHRVAGVYAATVVYFYSGEWRVFTPALTGMAVDRQGRIWVVETGPSPNTFVGFDPTKNTIISITPIPSGAGSSMVFGICTITRPREPFGLAPMKTPSVVLP